MPSSRDDEILKANTFHEWWLAELRTSLAPTERDAPPSEPPPQPEALQRTPVRPRGMLAFACAVGLFAGAGVMAAVDGDASASAAVPTPVAPAAAPVVEGIVEVGEIIVVNPAPDPEAASAERQRKQPKSKRPRKATARR